MDKVKISRNLTLTFKPNTMYALEQSLIYPEFKPLDRPPSSLFLFVLLLQHVGQSSSLIPGVELVEGALCRRRRPGLGGHSHMTFAKFRIFDPLPLSTFANDLHSNIHATSLTSSACSLGTPSSPTKANVICVCSLGRRQPPAQQVRRRGR